MPRRIKAKTRTGKTRTKSRTKSRVIKSSQNQSELEKIEKLLGEDFESLSEAKKALKESSGPVPNKKSYNIKELSTKKHRTIKTLLVDMEKHHEEIDSLKKPSEFWAARIYGNGTYSVYGNISMLAKQLGTYQGLQKEHPEQALKNIDVVKIKGIDAVKYLKKRRAEREASWKKAKERDKIDRARQRKQKKRIRDLEKQVKTLEKQLKESKKTK